MLNTDAFAADLAEQLSLLTAEPWIAARHRQRADAHTLCATADGATLMLRPARERGRITVVGAFRLDAEDLHDHRHDYTRQHTITVAASRPTVVIAREIKRRLLTIYRADLAEARRRMAAYAAARAEETATAAALAAIIGGQLAQGKHDTFYNRSGGIDITGRVSHSAGITLELSNLSIDVAWRILAILKHESPIKL